VERLLAAVGARHADFARVLAVVGRRAIQHILLSKVYTEN
jgi:hypothetical protein